MVTLGGLTHSQRRDLRAALSGACRAPGAALRRRRRGRLARRHRRGVRGRIADATSEYSFRAEGLGAPDRHRRRWAADGASARSRRSREAMAPLAHRRRRSRCCARARHGCGSSRPAAAESATRCIATVARVVRDVRDGVVSRARGRRCLRRGDRRRTARSVIELRRPNAAAASKASVSRCRSDRKRRA